MIEKIKERLEYIENNTFWFWVFAVLVGTVCGVISNLFLGWLQW